ncbi:hypothetical protein [Thermococcus henrietii]|uniref:hypothetical protein n=1 Tax=Thermococcus henrietii TaxID=2016361 RepID=UPI0011AB78E3|nr:hypothetical protein [Thermococcus henrietii]
MVKVMKNETLTQMNIETVANAAVTNAQAGTVLDNFVQNWDRRLKQFSTSVYTEVPMLVSLGKEVCSKQREDFPYYNSDPTKRNGDIFIWKRELTEEEKEKLKEWRDEEKFAVLLVGKTQLPITVKVKENQWAFRVRIPASVSRLFFMGKHSAQVKVFENGLLIKLPKNILNPQFFDFKNGEELLKGGSNDE